MDQVEEIKKKTDIVAVISDYTELKKAGRNFKGLCPFHGEKTPSFMVSPELQIYKCFGCQVGGDVYKFLMDLEHIEFPQALKILADRAGITLVQQKGFARFAEKDEFFSLNFIASEFYHYLLTKHQVGEKARTYLTNRGIDTEAIETFKLGYSPDKPDAVFQFLTKKRGYSPKLLEKAGLVVQSRGNYFDRFRGRIIFPLKDHFGNVAGFAGRVIDGRGDVAKYINSPETLVYNKGKMLYGLEIAKQEIKKEKYAVLVEGEIDCISCWQAGIKNVVAIKGSALTEDQALLLSRFTDRIVLALDADFAGNEAARRGLEIVQKQGLTVQIASFEGYKDPDEMAQKDPETLKKILNEAEGVYDFLINLVFKRINVETTEGKAKASRELIPILARIDDEIVQAHCLRVVAQRLGVPEEAVLAQLRKNPQGERNIKKQIQIQEKSQAKTRREILEEHLLAFAFYSNPGLLLESKIRDLVKTPLKMRFLDEFGKIYQKESFDLATFAQKLPAELQDFFSIVILSEVDIQDSKDVDQEVKNLTNELEMVDIKEKMTNLTTALKKLEIEGKEEEGLVLESEIDALGRKLSELEAQTG